ncbi:MAG: tetratricopeptide repeat protein [Bacteroidia bacterium]
MEDAILQKATLLMQQERYKEAQQLLMGLLSTQPDNDIVLYLLAEIKIEENDLDKAEELNNSAIGLDPERGMLFHQKARIYLLRDNYTEAQAYVQEAIALEPDEAVFYALLGYIKTFQKDFNGALAAADQALECDPSELLALNVRSTALLKLNRHEESFATIEGALHESPDNSFTHSNYGWNLLEKGDTKAALNHFREALRNDPNSMHAQSGMQEALKAKFIVYRLYLKYVFFMANLTSKYQWGVILGFYFGTKILSKIAQNNSTLAPYLTPVVILLSVLALSTWVMHPLGNVYLRFNPYGKHLLDREEKITSTTTSVFLLFSLGFFITLLATGQYFWAVPAIFTLSMMLPISRFYVRPAGFYKTYTIGMFVVGVLATAVSLLTGELFSLFTLVYVIGFVGFQFLANYFSIRKG